MSILLVPYRTKSGDIAYEGAHQECLDLFDKEPHAVDDADTISCIHCGGCGGLVTKPTIYCLWHGPADNCPIINDTFTPRVPF